MTIRRLTPWTLAAALALLGACSTPTEEGPAVVGSLGAPLGVAACDEYLSHARACIAKGRFGDIEAKKVELVAVESALRQVIAGAPVALERSNVWASALRLPPLAATKALAPEESAAVERVPNVELCKRALDQLPTECQ